MELGRVVPLTPADESYLSIRRPAVLAMIQRGDPPWTRMVPRKVAEIIEADRLFR